MNELLTKIEDKVFYITFNRITKHNAFDDHLLLLLQQALDAAIADPKARVIVLKANGKHFSAGADIKWMQRTISFNEDENIHDAMLLAKVMHTLHQSPKPTIVSVQGAAFGGGVGLVAACDIAIATHQSQFCFSEVKLGLIPAVISPYVVKAIGERAAKSLFMSAEIFDAAEAKQLQLLQYCVDEQELEAFVSNYARKIAHFPPQTVRDCKSLVAKVSHQPITDSLVYETAKWIAKKRISNEGQRGMQAFLNKETLTWDDVKDNTSLSFGS